MISPTTLIAFITVLIIIGFSASAKNKTPHDEPLIIFFTQKLILVSLSILILSGIWYLVLIQMDNTSAIWAIGAGLVVSTFFIYRLFKSWHTLERYLSQFVHGAFQRNSK